MNCCVSYLILFVACIILAFSLVFMPEMDFEAFALPLEQRATLTFKI